jgi:hypothetical protein
MLPRNSRTFLETRTDSSETFASNGMSRLDFMFGFFGSDNSLRWYREITPNGSDRARRPLVRGTPFGSGLERDIAQSTIVRGHETCHSVSNNRRALNFN